MPFEYFKDTSKSDGIESQPQTNISVQKSRDSSPVAQNGVMDAPEEELEGLGVADIKENAKLARVWAAIYRLFQRPYFRQMWVVQEIAAASAPTVWCGKRRVSWQDLRLQVYA